MDAPLRPQCPKGERYYKGTCRKIYGINSRGTRNNGYATTEN
jgi:hypothetical protein